MDLEKPFGKVGDDEVDEVAVVARPTLLKEIVEVESAVHGHLIYRPGLVVGVGVDDLLYREHGIELVMP